MSRRCTPTARLTTLIISSRVSKRSLQPFSRENRRSANVCGSRAQGSGLGKEAEPYIPAGSGSLEGRRRLPQWTTLQSRAAAAQSRRLRGGANTWPGVLARAEAPEAHAAQGSGFRAEPRACRAARGSGFRAKAPGNHVDEGLYLGLCERVGRACGSCSSCMAAKDSWCLSAARRSYFFTVCTTRFSLFFFFFLDELVPCKITFASQVLGFNVSTICTTRFSLFFFFSFVDELVPCREGTLHEPGPCLPSWVYRPGPSLPRVCRRGVDHGQ